MKNTVALVSIALLIAGCSDPKAPNTKNFETAINDWIGQNPPCLAIPVIMTVREPDRAEDADLFPLFVETADSQNTLRLENLKRAAKPFEALVAAGLLKSEPAEIQQSGYFSSTPTTLSVTAYNLTDEGKKAFVENGQKSALFGGSPSFCYGEPRVTKIERFTEPGQMMGMTVSQVEYAYEVEKMPRWTEHAALQDAFPQLKRDHSGAIQDKAAVVLTSEGWVHERAMKR